MGLEFVYDILLFFMLEACNSIIKLTVVRFWRYNTWLQYNAYLSLSFSLTTLVSTSSLLRFRILVLETRYLIHLVCSCRWSNFKAWRSSASDFTSLHDKTSAFSYVWSKTLSLSSPSFYLCFYGGFLSACLVVQGG